MDIRRTESLPLKNEQDIVSVRQRARDWATSAGLGTVAKTQFITAASELGRNTVKYGGGGTAVIDELSDPPRVGVRLTFADAGPGIADVQQALRDGFTTGGGLGLGLGGARRLCSEFEIESRPGVGTRVVITKWK